MNTGRLAVYLYGDRVGINGFKVGVLLGAGVRVGDLGPEVSVARSGSAVDFGVGVQVGGSEN